MAPCCRNLWFGYAEELQKCVTIEGMYSTFVTYKNIDYKNASGKQKFSLDFRFMQYSFS